MTLDTLITVLQRARASSPLKGETVVTLCRKGSGVPNATIEDVFIQLEDEGALVEIIGTFEGDPS